MDEIKHKILSLLNKQVPKIPSMGFTDANYHFSKGETLSINSKTVTDADRPADQDILESIEAAYFAIDEDFDICRFELSKLPDILDCDEIQCNFKKLKQQHQVVSKKVLQLILERQNSCREEFKESLLLRDKLGETLSFCHEGRKELHIAEKQLSNTLSVLANYRKRNCAENLLDNLNTIKTLYRTDYRLQELLNEENYAGAIELILECQRAAQRYRHFNCVAAFTNKLQETLEATEEQLDQVLAKMCYYFDDKRYAKLQAAYNLLGKTQIAVDHLHMHYISAIYNTAINIVHMYVKNPEIYEINDNLNRKPYKNLCVSVDQENFIPCLTELCKSMFKIILSYYNLVRWHNANDDVYKESDLEDSFNKKYIKQKLEHNLLKIWQDVQSKTSALLMNSDLSMYKFEQFLQVLGIVHRLIKVGEEFCGSKSEELQQSIRKQSVNYFQNYHTQKLEELRIFMENESWEICPVKHTFNILQLQEFSTLRHTLKNFKKSLYISHNTYQNSTDCGSSSHSQDSSTIAGNYFIRYSERKTPFDSKFDSSFCDEDILAVGDEASGYFSEESEEENEDLRKDFVDDYNDESIQPKNEKKDKISQSPILTNTTLSVLRQMGNYLQMSRLLRPIALDIIIRMNELFDFYLYSVHEFYATDLPVSSTKLYSQNLSMTIKRIQENLIWEENVNEMSDKKEINKVTKPRISAMVNLKLPDNLYGVRERIVAVESLIFLSKQYEFLQEFLEYLIPQNKIKVQHFFTQTIGSAVSLRKPVYMAAIAQIYDLRQTLISMSKINWEVKDVMSQHNNYIDFLLREIQIFKMRLDKINLSTHIPIEVMASLWENVAHIVTHTLVQGFSEAKKCSNGGRALMQLDFTQFLSKFEKISGIRPVPHREYVENYVKAYYLPELELENWIRDHTEYSTKHLFGLVSCTCQNKKSKQRLLQVIEEIERSTMR